MMARRIEPGSPPSADFALFVQGSRVGAHVGILYRRADSTHYRLLHQAWHRQTPDDELANYVQDMGEGKLLLYVLPALDEDEQADLRTHAALVALRIKEGGIPYAFHARNASFTAQGVVNLGESFGLTCATFITRFFSAVNVPLIDEDGWETQRSPERREQDKAAQSKLVGYLEQSREQEDRNQARRVRGDIGCARIRAEEVAAASGIKDRPVGYSRCEPAGRPLLAEIQGRSKARTDQLPAQ